ncbi:hypothetical protein DRQ25_15605 [Candidatus Fermentibacteria bacterium]|nr:MAG: hypothetical protein DRQ25_15605 [Candidatus Fermentibacteria bacterium]
MKVDRRNFLIGIPAAALAVAIGKPHKWQLRPHKMGVTMSTKKFTKVVGETMLRHQKDFYNNLNHENVLFKRLMQ